MHSFTQSYYYEHQYSGAGLPKTLDQSSWKSANWFKADTYTCERVHSNTQTSAHTHTHTHAHIDTHDDTTDTQSIMTSESIQHFNALNNS
jgi:hypothetical protein